LGTGEAQVHSKSSGDALPPDPHVQGSLLQVKHSEGTFEELAKGGAPPEGPAYADGDAASAALQAVAPVGVKLFRLERLLLR
jgi:hypothetical protein